MKTVYKYPIQLTDQMQNVEMPAGAKVIHVAFQKGVLCLWALVDNERVPTSRTFHVAGTGHQVFETTDYLGTVHTEGMGGFPLVFHVFEYFQPF